MKSKQNIYERKSQWKLVLFIIALLIILTTLWYTNKLAKEVAELERQKVEQVADVYAYLNTASEIQDYGFLIDIIQSNESIPVIWTDSENNILDYRNIDSSKAAGNSHYLDKQLLKMQEYAPPIEIDITKGKKQFLYYTHSRLYSIIRYYPLFQLIIIGAFLFSSYILFSTARRAEQNRVWVGLAKETAHQLGTPISSLVAWIEYLRETIKGEENQKAIEEMEKDVQRLELITERFSKVGSSPDLQYKSIQAAVERSVDYIRRRASKKVEISVQKPSQELFVHISESLFDWVIENLLKNALDAIDGSGKINVLISENNNEVHLDISDNGKGIPKSKFKTIFEPGFSTKRRGWGLGLTLTKRIVENYHSGKIFVKKSYIGEGTTFRITLPKAAPSFAASKENMPVA